MNSSSCANKWVQGGGLDQAEEPRFTGRKETLLAVMRLARGSNTRSLISRMTKYSVIQTRMLSVLNYTEEKRELLINMLRQEINCNSPRAD